MLIDLNILELYYFYSFKIIFLFSIGVNNNLNNFIFLHINCNSSWLEIKETPLNKQFHYFYFKTINSDRHIKLSYFL